MLHYSVVHRLPQNYRWLAGFIGSKVEAIPPGGQPVNQQPAGNATAEHSATENNTTDNSAMNNSAMDNSAVDNNAADNSLVALKLLSPNDENAWSVMQKLSQALTDIEVDCSVLECEGEPCLFVKRQDECMATCRLKNCGVAIAESFAS